MAAITPSREELAETIHKARWPLDRQMAITSFADEDQNAREYCLRIADAVLDRLAAKPADEGVGHPETNAEIADRMQQTYDVSGDRWFKIAADRLRSPSATGAAEPVACWVIPGNDTADANGFISAMAFKDGEFTKPLYATPPVRGDREAISQIAGAMEDLATDLDPEASALLEDLADKLTALHVQPGAGERAAVDWVLYRDPGCVAQRNGPFRQSKGELAGFLREMMEAHPNAFLTVLTLYPHGDFGLQDGPDVLQILDGRSAPIARKHRERLSRQPPQSSSDGGGR